MWVNADGHVGAQDVASIEIDPDRTVYCCLRGVHFTLAYRLYEWKKAIEADPPAIAAKLEELAELGGVGLTPQQMVVDRAMATVALINQTMSKMQATGELREWNQAFKAARAAEPSVRYADYLDARKAAMVESIAHQATC